MARYCFLILLLCGQAWATDYHVCDCLTGAHASCSAGSNANAGTSSSAPKQTLAGYTWSSLAEGDRVLVCEGGSLTASALQIANTNGTRASPITIDTYAPPSGATGTPIFRANGTADFIVFGSFFNETPIGHYVVRGINFDGLMTGDHAMYVFGVASLRVENVTFQQWGFGIELACTTITCSNNTSSSTNVTIRNSTFARNTQMGILGGADNLVIEDSLFSKNATSSDPGFKHNIYLNNFRGGLVRRNTFIDPGNADTDGTTCNQGNFTIHGLVSGLVLENNSITNTTVASGCGGISVTPGYSFSEEMRDVVLRGNRLRNAVVRIACAPRVVVESNSIVFTEQPIASPFLMPATDCAEPDPDEALDTGGVIRNNSMLFDFALSSGVVGFSTNGGGAGVGSSVTFTGNLVRFQNTGGAGSRTCFSNTSLANYTYHGNNGCFNFSAWSSENSTLALSQTAGYDTGSLNSDPGFAATPGSGNNWSMKLGGSSPYLAAGSATHGPRRAIDGWLRPATPSIGAFDANNP